jgi:hypothetical protein
VGRHRPGFSTPPLMLLGRVTISAIFAAAALVIS